MNFKILYTACIKVLHILYCGFRFITQLCFLSKARYLPAFFLFTLSGIIISSCTKDITINLPHQESQLVVEGHIEKGMPPFVVLTKSSDYYSTIYLDSLSSYFVHGSVVKVSDGLDTIILDEIFLDTAGTLISLYTSFAMLGEEGKTYSLSVEAEGEILNSSTTIPLALPLDSIWWEPAFINDADTFVNLVCQYTDPPLPGQYVRYFTKENSQPYYPGYNSVFEDNLINGTTFNFTLDRGVSRNDTASFYEGYFKFRRGDTITVKWCAIDQPHFDFWRTLEFELSGQGSPFASPVIIQGNIEGALGIWGGYNPDYKTVIVPE
ncbi:MAG: DUF4249 domain-containing protein [Chitinophagales bacterium]